MPVTATTFDLDGSGALLCDAGNGALLCGDFSGEGDWRLLYDAEVGTRIVGTKRLNVQSVRWAHTYKSGYLGFPYGNSSSKASLQYAVDSILPPASTVYESKTPSYPQYALSASLSVGPRASTFQYDLPLWFYGLFPSNDWPGIAAAGMPHPYRISIASLAPTIRLVNHKVDDIAVCLAFSNPALDMAYGDEIDRRATAAASLVSLPSDPDDADIMFIFSADGSQTATYTPSAEIDLLSADGTVRDLCIQPWYPGLSVEGCWTGGTGWGSSMNPQAYCRQVENTDGGSPDYRIPVQLVLYVAGDQTANVNVNAYAHYFGLT